MEEKEQSIRDEYQQLQTKLQDSSIFSTPEYPKLAKRQGQLETLLALFDTKHRLDQQRSSALELAQSEDDELASLARTELEQLEKQIGANDAALREALVPKDPNDQKNAIIEIRAGTGGDESTLFVDDLYRMYFRLAERRGWKTELISESPSEVGGFKEISFKLIGDDVYGALKFESGVHRVQRVPTTESQGRIHTSAITVAVLPEAEATEVAIDPKDLRIDVFRSSGHGGQSVNTTDSAVRITHLPTGLVVTCQDEKSQLKNKDKAMGVLRSRLLQMKIDEEKQQLSDKRKKLIGSGDRSEKIRTYNFPQDRITDHRIHFSRSNITSAMDGGIDDLLEAVQKVAQEEKES